MSQKHKHPPTRNQQARALAIIQRSLRNYKNRTETRYTGCGVYNQVVGESIDFWFEKVAVAENNNFSDWSLKEMVAARRASETIEETAVWLNDAVKRQKKAKAQARKEEIATTLTEAEEDYHKTIEGFLDGRV